jgi:hypothetical protein
MKLSEFIKTYNIRPADAIIMQKKLFGMLDHYVIYMGIMNGQHKFIANYKTGVDYIPERDLHEYLQKLVPIDIDRFTGNELQRKYAVNRALSRIGEKAYDLFYNNCEHFKNFVHYGKSKSKQVENFKTGLKVVGILALLIAFVSLFSKD